MGGSPARAATVAVHPVTVGAPLPTGFLGLSTETYSLLRYTGDDPRALDPAFLRLLRQIGPGGSPTLLPRQRIRKSLRASLVP